LELHAFETIVILSLVAMETAAIFPSSLQVLQFLLSHWYRSIAMFEKFQCKIIRKKKCIYKYRQFTKATHSTSDGSLYRGIVCKSICEPSELLYSREPRVIVSERSRIVSMKSIILVYFEKLAGCLLLARNKKRDIAMI
ncbi:conserved hypothetical protein, partial [Trichinella spiralis]|uniref:hypothetical protein n=1 Tax=Trichinella spiralis TaxID=6334 RepID=UPI0001EFE0EF